jgi:NAD+ synthase/NAD+ synthase (glutamine-hydrolysing)
MRIALLQLNQIVGDLVGNAARIRAGVTEAKSRGADLIVTPELALLGYPPRDLLLQRGFIEQSWEALARLASELREAPPVLVGVAEPNKASEGRPLFNTAALLAYGEVRARFRKSLLPTYDVFEEDRYFEPAADSQVLRLGGAALGVTVCEDIWNDRDFWKRRRYRSDPVEESAWAGAQCVINLSASPFSAGKQRLREAMLGQMASKHGLPLVYVNQVGGNDDLVFDCRSCAFDGAGKLIARARAFEEDLSLVDLNPPRGQIEEDESSAEGEIWKALVLGTCDYVHKCGYSRVLLGLSGGIDSSLTAAVAVEAVGAENVLGVLMPSPYSSPGSVEDAKRLARNLSIRVMVLPIDPMMQAFEAALAPAFAGRGRDVTEENIQARIRGSLLMALSNKYGALLLTTGNKSELAVGYCTLYGDMSGGLAVISDVPKTMIYRLARWLNSQRTAIPDAVLTKAPSAELRPNQTDQDSLPPYDLLDEILARHIEQHKSEEEIVAEGFDKVTVRRVLHMARISEFKRRQAAPGLKVTDCAFGVGWRMPIACREWEKRKSVLKMSGTSME